jgi:transcriptional regulator with PAS, ATPase and Fis domain
MLKITLTLLIAVTYVNASFWGSLFGSALGGSGGANVVINEKEALLIKNNKKTQQALRAMNYYKSENIDGNLNTFDSRSAIETFQIDLGYDKKDTPTYIQTLLGTANKNSFYPGILNKYTQENLVYQFELTDEFSNLYYNNEANILTTLSNILKRKEQLLQATQTNEKRLSKNSKVNTIISKNMAKAIEKEKKDLKELRENLNNTLKEKKNVYVDTKQKLIWQDTSLKKMYQTEAVEYCKKLSLNGLTYWRLPSMKEYNNIHSPLTTFNFIPQEWSHGNYVWISEKNYAYDLKDKDDDYASATRYKIDVKCVHPFE